MPQAKKLSTCNYSLCAYYNEVHYFKWNNLTYSDYFYRTLPELSTEDAFSIASIVG